MKNDDIEILSSSFLTHTSFKAFYIMAIQKGYLKQNITLYIHSGLITEAKEILKTISTNSEKDYTAPYINLKVDENLQPYNWYLDINGHKIGSSVE